MDDEISTNILVNQLKSIKMGSNILWILLVAFVVGVFSEQCPNENFKQKHVCFSNPGVIAEVQECARLTSRLRNAADWSRGGEFKIGRVLYRKFTLFVTPRAAINPVTQSANYRVR